jgi:hypothetical protein
MSRMVGFYWSPVEQPVDEQLDLLKFTGANLVCIPRKYLKQAPLEELRRQNIQVLIDWTMFAGEELRQRFPDGVPVDETGTPFDREDWYVPLCPNHPQLRAQHMEALSDLLDQYNQEFAGIWLDFIRYPVRWEAAQPKMRKLCFCKNCLNLFLEEAREAYSQEETRALASEILQERAEEWVDWKCNRIVGVVQEVKAQIMRRNLDIKLGMFSLPWRRTDFDGAIRKVAAQDLGRLAAHIDLFSPMVYHKLCYQPPAWVQAVAQEVREWTQKPVLPVVQSIHQPSPMEPEELDDALNNALHPAFEGAMIFTLEPVLKSKEMAAVVRKHFQG